MVRALGFVNTCLVLMLQWYKHLIHGIILFTNQSHEVYMQHVYIIIFIT